MPAVAGTKTEVEAEEKQRDGNIWMGAWCYSPAASLGKPEIRRSRSSRV